MDEPGGNTPEVISGNAAIPDWLLKRRSRMQVKSEIVRFRERPAAEQAESVEETGLAPNSTSVALDTADTTIQPLSDSAMQALQQPAAARDVAVAECGPTDQLENPFVQPSESPQPTPEVFPQFEIPPAPPVQKSKARAQKKAPVAPLIKPIDEPQVELTWFETIRQRWLGKDVLGGYAVSLGAHLCVALLLSLVVLHQQNAGAGGELNTFLVGGGDEGGSGETIDGSSVLDIPPAEGQVAAPEVDTVLAASAVSGTIGPSELSIPGEVGSSRVGSGGGEGDGEGNGVGSGIGDGANLGGFKMPEGGKVVRKGSFTAWTVPEDPQPGEDYKIIIQVKYKNKNQRLSPDDVTGSVVGTDKYRLMISRHTSEIIPDASQVVVYIPGAAARVRDTIKVYSATLRENQKLEITF